MVDEPFAQAGLEAQPVIRTKLCLVKSVMCACVRGAGDVVVQVLLRTVNWPAVIGSAVSFRRAPTALALGKAATNPFDVVATCDSTRSQNIET